MFVFAQFANCRLGDFRPSFDPGDALRVQSVAGHGAGVAVLSAGQRGEPFYWVYFAAASLYFWRHRFRSCRLVGHVFAGGLLDASI